MNFSQLTVGERLKIARKAKKFTGQEVGGFIGVGKSMISNIENGTNELTRANAAVLCEKLGFTMQWILEGKGEPPEPIRNTGTNYNTNSASGNTMTYNNSAENKNNSELDYLRQRVRELEEQNKDLLSRIFKMIDKQD